MSEYLGFEPSANPFYFFLSYNSEDKETVGNLAKTMMHSGINIWYDYGINYGDGWEETITTKINNSQGLILFFTRGILSKKDSYVQKEYKIAKFLHCKVYVIFIDKIKNEDVPLEKVSWWLDISEKQNVNLYENDVAKTIEQLSALLGIQTHEEKMNKIIESYNKLYFEGRISDADSLLNEYLRGVSLKGKVELISSLIKGGFSETKLLSSALPFDRTTIPKDKPLRTHKGEEIQDFYEGKEIVINGDVFVIGNDVVYHGGHGDAQVIWIWKNSELIHTISSLIDAYKLNVYWDSINNIVYISYISDYDPFMQKLLGISGGDEVREALLSVTTIEHPNDMTVCTDFRFIDL